MSKVAVVTDSNSGISQELADKMGISVLPMPFTIDGKEYFEGISLTQEEFYEYLKKDADIATSQPSPESVLNLWKELLKEYDEVLHIPMSSGLSGSCQTAIALADDFDGRVQVVNNHRISITHLVSRESRFHFRLEVLRLFVVIRMGDVQIYAAGAETAEALLDIVFNGVDHGLPGLAHGSGLGKGIQPLALNGQHRL